MSSGSACRRRLPAAIGSRAPPAPARDSSLDPYRRKTCVLLVPVLSLGVGGRVTALPYNRLAARGRKPDGLLYRGSGFALRRGLPAAIGSRAPPCTRKGHRPLTRIGAKLAFCLSRFYLLGWVGGSRLIPYCRLTAKGRKPDGLLYEVQIPPVGEDCLAAIGSRAPPAPARDIVP